MENENINTNGFIIKPEHKKRNTILFIVSAFVILVIASVFIFSYMKNKRSLSVEEKQQIVNELSSQSEEISTKDRSEMMKIISNQN